MVFIFFPQPSLFQCAFFFFVSGAPTMSDTTSALATILSLEAYGSEEQFDVSHMATQSGVYVAILSSCTCLYCFIYCNGRRTLGSWTHLQIFEHLFHVYFFLSLNDPRRFLGSSGTTSTRLWWWMNTHGRRARSCFIDWKTSGIQQCICHPSFNTSWTTHPARVCFSVHVNVCFAVNVRVQSRICSVIQL